MNTIPCPARCPGGMAWSESLGDFAGECLVCHGYAFIWEDGTPIDSKPELADPFDYTCEKEEV